MARVARGVHPPLCTTYPVEVVVYLLAHVTLRSTLVELGDSVFLGPAEHQTEIILHGRPLRVVHNFQGQVIIGDGRISPNQEAEQHQHDEEDQDHTSYHKRKA